MPMEMQKDCPMRKHSGLTMYLSMEKPKGTG